MRYVNTTSGIWVGEEIVTNDSELHRFQYRIISGAPFDHHLATVDLIDANDGTLVIYAADVAPEEMGPAMQQSVAGAVEALKEYLE